MADRRSFLAGVLTAAILPKTGWAAAGAPSVLGAAKVAGDYRLFGLDEAGEEIFSLPLPGRGHAAAAHPTKAEAIAFARRPGTFAIVLDCRSGREIARLEAPEGRHFYGHGAFTPDGDLLLTPENDYDSEDGAGRIGVWKRSEGYRRVADLPSGGIGPHDVARLPGGGYVVANGGIMTHPDTGRVALNLPTMRANLTYLNEDLSIAEAVELDLDKRMNSIRHLAVRGDGLVAFAMQWQGDGDGPPLLGLHRRGEAPVLCRAPDASHHAMVGYAGSVAFSGDGRLAGITSPRGSRAQFFDAATGAFVDEVEAADICGLASAETGFIASGGDGTVRFLHQEGTPTRHAAAWDNHLVLV